LVLAVMFHLFLGKNHMIEKLFALRECRDRLIAFFEKLSINDALGPIAILAGTTLVVGTAVAVVPLTLAGAAALVLGGLGLTGLVAWLTKDKPCCDEAKKAGSDLVSHSPDCPNAPGSYVMPPKTGDSNAIIIGVVAIGGLALLGAALMLKKRRRYV
jgi:LPXTG-motif cell wall-anchored protein